MLIINALQNFQAKTQAVLECHNVRMITPNKGGKINGKIGDEPVFFYGPFIGQHVSVVDVVVRIRQESIERFSMVLRAKKDAFLKWTNEKNNKVALEYAGHLERIFSHYAIIPYS